MGWNLYLAWAKVYIVTKWHLDPSSQLATKDMGRKLGSAVPLWGAGSTSNTMWPGTRPASIPSGILIHLAVWPQQTWAKNWGLMCPFYGGGTWVPIKHNVVWAEAYLRIKWHLNPSSHLATIHGPKIGASPFGHGIGWTILQTVAQKRNSWSVGLSHGEPLKQPQNGIFLGKIMP